MKDPIFDLQSLADDLWHEKKGLEWESTLYGKKRIFKKMQKIIDQIKALDFDSEIKILKDIHNVVDETEEKEGTFKFKNLKFKE